MPTGYTCDVQDGKIATLRDFAMQCARAFGATITMRDDPLNAEIPEEFQPHDWNATKLSDAKRRRVEINLLSSEERTQRAEAQYQKELRSYDETAAGKALAEKRYTDMLAKVRAWPAPADLLSLKEFMVEQLMTSIALDCSMTYYEKPRLLSGDDWAQETLKTVERDIVYHAKEHAAEVERVAGRNQWLRTLRESLAAQDVERAAHGVK